MARQQLGKSCVEGRSDRVIDNVSHWNTWLLMDTVSFSMFFPSLLFKMADGFTKKKKSLCFVHLIDLINHAEYFEFLGTSPN